MTIAKYALLLLLSAGLAYGIAELAGQRTAGDPATTATSASGSSAARPAPSPSGRAENLRQLTAGLKAVGTARQSGSDDAKLEAYRVPILDPPPPLQQLSMTATDAETGRAAADLALWLKMTTEQAVRDCWQNIPRLPVWAEFEAEVSERDAETLGVGKLRLRKVHGDYQLSGAETQCFASAVSTITARGGSKAAIAALQGRLPITENFVIQWPCVACRPINN